MIDISKHNRAIEGINKWKANRGIGTLNYVPGFGKTRTGLLVAKEVLVKYPNDHVLVVVPSIAVEEVWNNALQQEDEYLNFADREKEHIVIFGVTTALHSMIAINTDYKLMIVDEIHKFTSEDRYTIFSTFKYTSILGLTGTYPIGRRKSMLDIHCPVVDVITESEALNKNWISQFREYNIKCELSDDDKVRYEKFSIPIFETLDLFSNIHKKFRRADGDYLFKDDYQVIQSCKSGLKTKDLLGNSMYITATNIRLAVAAMMEWSLELDLTSQFGKDRDDYWNPENIKTRVLNFTDFVAKRNEIIINNQVKLQMVLKIFNKFPNKTICFNESTDFANDIAEALNTFMAQHIAIVYHSKIESKPIWDDALNDYFRYGSGQKKGEIKIFGQKTLRDNAIRGLVDGTYSFLSTARALDEGLDIPTLEQVITTAGTANPIQYTQRTGRGKRVDIYNPDKVTKIFNLYFDDFIGTNANLVKSRDKQKLIAKQRERNSTVIWLNDLGDISDD